MSKIHIFTNFLRIECLTAKNSNYRKAKRTFNPGWGLIQELSALTSAVSFLIQRCTITENCEVLNGGVGWNSSGNSRIPLYFKLSYLTKSSDMSHFNFANIAFLHFNKIVSGVSSERMSFTVLSGKWGEEGWIS